MPLRNLRGIDIYYEISGVGPKVLFLNITGGDLRQRPNIFDSPLAARHTVLALDQRGLGQSGRPDIPYTMADYADDAAALLEALDWGPTPVVGVSFGGMVAQELALRHPGLVTRLVLACTTSGGAGGSSYPLHELAALPAEQKAARMVELGDLRRDAAWRQAHPEEFGALVEQALARLRLGADEPNRALGARRQLEARIGHDTHDRLKGVQAPTLVCGGLFDGVARPPALAALAAAIPGARLELFQGGHQFLDQDPRAWERVLDFLAQGQGLAAGMAWSAGLPAGWSPPALALAAMGASPVCITVLDLEGRLLFYSRYGPKILDRRPEYLGRDVRGLHTPASADKISAILDAYRAGGRDEHTWQLHRAGKVFTVRVTPLVLAENNRGLVHVVMLMPPAAA
ncbi:MAG: alpha/beta fold hydrolase [Thermodesulfobacteriota bacterium]